MLSRQTNIPSFNPKKESYSWINPEREDSIVSGAYSPNNENYSLDSNIYSGPRLYSFYGKYNLSSNQYHTKQNRPNSDDYHRNTGTYQPGEQNQKNIKPYQRTTFVYQYPHPIDQLDHRRHQSINADDPIFINRKHKNQMFLSKQALGREFYPGANFNTGQQVNPSQGITARTNIKKIGLNEDGLEVSRVRINLLAGVAKRNAAQGKVNYREVEKRILDGILGPQVYDNRMRPHVSPNYILNNFYFPSQIIPFHFLVFKIIMQIMIIIVRKELIFATLV